MKVFISGRVRTRQNMLNCINNFLKTIAQPNRQCDQRTLIIDCYLASTIVNSKVFQWLRSVGILAYAIATSHTRTNNRQPRPLGVLTMTPKKWPIQILCPKNILNEMFPTQPTEKQNFPEKFCNFQDLLISNNRVLLLITDWCVLQDVG